jgi:pimeloyl-ACP methyl ester carboxylesterase
MNELRNAADEALDHQFHPADARNYLVILGHGLTGNKDRPLLVALAEGLSKLGWPCLRISFSGNGESGGRFTDSCITKQVADLKAVLDTVPDHVSVAYIGHSMGGAVGLLTALEDVRIRALVSLAGMMKPAEFAVREFAGVTPDQGCIWEDENFPLSSTLVDDMNRIGSLFPVVEKTLLPLLLIHGTEDDVVPVSDSREARDVASGDCELMEIPGAGHVFGDESYPPIIANIHRWLTTQFGRK